MNATHLHRHFAALAAALAVGGYSAAAQAHDYPTSDRVLFVEACMAKHPGARFEMLSKCSCALDKIASEVPFSDYETMATATNANSIGGERGNAIRDAEPMQEQIKRFRTIQAAANKGCFINDDAK